MIGLIPAGGIGSRLGLLTKEIPKPLIKIGDRTLIENTIKSLAAVGVSKFVVVVNYKKEVIIDYLKKLSVNFIIVGQPILNGLPGAIIAAKKHLNERFIMHLPDNIITRNYDYLIKLHEKEKPITTLLLEKSLIRENRPYVKFNGNIVKFVELGTGKLDWAEVGVSVHEPEFIEYCEKIVPSERGELEYYQALKKMLASGEKICAVKIKGKRIDITSKEDYLEYSDYKYAW